MSDDISKIHLLVKKLVNVTCDVAAEEAREKLAEENNKALAKACVGKQMMAKRGSLTVTGTIETATAVGYYVRVYLIDNNSNRYGPFNVSPRSLPR